MLIIFRKYILVPVSSLVTWMSLSESQRWKGTTYTKDTTVIDFLLRVSFPLTPTTVDFP